jgi:hypothetical protein
MKHLKHFENINEPEVGDYAICENYVNSNLKILDDFLLTNIGLITNIHNRVKDYPYIIKFEKIPAELKTYTEDNMGTEMMFQKEEIVHFSKNKEDLEYIISANKYNL